mmetsp:Transcript_11223/g.23256  ORF Transcript_11223/g.23256 Transcript_11223/m.23256 type:complete len:402 (+) Transcript_11223:73-1278(+)|eukprot:CAMPEP_0197269660 /NCGR_PEP_ID=MMETSP1432-20130617/5833_1 /TAXON_ID=44447 /ORGANISM="Pseudo-nitzschia delicatissima, Strain UNC1205" /LENGTH=401 /DNA_ID=CAMNT_0042734859 /DNA_START=72 /DNA_END=1277 /DNA_ORIENTATION=+
MARGFSIQDIACITLEGSLQAAPPVVAPTQKPSKKKKKLDLQQPLKMLPWFDKQKEKRRREHLQSEAEKQLQKIGEAQRAALDAKRESASSRHRESNATSNGVMGLVNPNRSLADSSSCSSSGSVDLVTNRSTEREMRPSNSFGDSRVSKSGEGASGMLSLSDIDGICVGPAAQVKEQETSDNIDDDNDNDSIEDTIGPVRVTEVDGDDASPYILSQAQMNEIAKRVLPETITYCRWRRLYGLGRDGDSFDGCLRIIGTCKKTLMVVRTTKGDVFGGYADAPWHSRHDSASAKFYGSASSCLYSFSSKQSEHSRSPMESSLNVYRWTGKNRYIQVCDVSNKMLAFGGGGDKGAFGLCLQEDFQRGTTGHCETFDNDPLCSNDERTFDIVDVEFWEFLTGVF